MALKLEDINLSHIYEYLATGALETANPEIVRYLDLLDKVRSMYLRLDEFGHKDLIVKHLIKVEGLSRYLANNIYNDAMEYFYCDKQISNESWGNILAEASRKDYIMAIQLAKTTADVVNASKIHLQIYKLKGLDKPEPMKVPESAFQQPFKMYSIDTEFLGLPKKNKAEIKAALEKFPEISERVMLRLEEEAALLPQVRLFIPDHENPRKS